MISCYIKSIIESMSTMELIGSFDASWYEWSWLTDPDRINPQESTSSYINHSLHLTRKYAWIFVRGHHLLREANSFPRAKTVSFEEQMMSKDKYPSIFSPQMEAIVFVILQIFFATREVLKIGEYSRIFPSFSWGIFGHVTRLDQSRASENIWWIIRHDILQCSQFDPPLLK